MVAMQTQPSPPPADPTAVIGRRIVAFLIDFGIGFALFVVLSILIAESATTSSSSCGVFTTYGWWSA